MGTDRTVEHLHLRCFIAMLYKAIGLFRSAAILICVYLRSTSEQFWMPINADRPRRRRACSRQKSNSVIYTVIKGNLNT